MNGTRHHQITAMPKLVSGSAQRRCIIVSHCKIMKSFRIARFMCPNSGNHPVKIAATPFLSNGNP